MDVKSFGRALVLATLCTWLTGCAAVGSLGSLLTGTPHLSGMEVHSETSVKLEESNFITIRTNVVGSSKGFKLLGLITLSPATLDTAMNRLYANAEVQPGRPQTFAHLIVENSEIYVILFSIPHVTARADLIEFLPADEEEETPSPQGHEIQTIAHRRTAVGRHPLRHQLVGH